MSREGAENGVFSFLCRRKEKLLGLAWVNELAVAKDLSSDRFLLRGHVGLRNRIRVGDHGLGRHADGFHVFTTNDDGVVGHRVQGPESANEPSYGEGAAEGTLHLHDSTGPFQIPYGCLVPKRLSEKSLF